MNMASNIYKINGMKYSRSVRQGARPLGLGKPFVQRLFEEDERILELVKKNLGCFYNKNDFVRSAVKYYINNIYTELLK